MPVVSIQQLVFVVCVAVFTTVAAVGDVRTRHIPNGLTLPMFVAGWVYQGVFVGWTGLADAGLGFAIGFGTLFVLWLVGGGGGGDAKLMGALSVWLGFSKTLLVLIGSTLLVVLAATAFILFGIFRRWCVRTKHHFTAPFQPAKRDYDTLPRIVGPACRRMMVFALPVALATWAVMLWKLPGL